MSETLKNIESSSNTQPAGYVDRFQVWKNEQEIKANTDPFHVWKAEQESKKNADPFLTWKAEKEANIDPFLTWKAAQEKADSKWINSDSTEQSILTNNVVNLDSSNEAKVVENIPISNEVSADQIQAVADALKTNYNFVVRIRDWKPRESYFGRWKTADCY